jgi:sugar-phosphatase
MLAATMRAAIFDLDGLLVDSEPIWRRVEQEVFATLGLHLSEAEIATTMGMRIDEVVAFRHGQRPWREPSQKVVVERIVEKMVEALRVDPNPMRGVRHALDVCDRAGLRLALASSSPERLIRAALDGLVLHDTFAVVQSAEHEPLGKPHPAVFLRTAERLGVAAMECVVLEDSLFGVIAAKAARMRCIAVPEKDTPKFAIADVVLKSLEELTASHLAPN